MIIKQFIEKAIEGGWKLRGNLGGEISHYEYETNTFVMKDGNTWVRPAIEVILLDPLAWRSAGFSEKEMLGLVSALWSGSTIENYLKML